MRMLRVSALFLLLLAMGRKIVWTSGSHGNDSWNCYRPIRGGCAECQDHCHQHGNEVSFQTVTNSAGDYNAPALNPGTYTVSAEARGFQKSVISSFTLTVNQHARVDLTLKPGAVTETVETTAQAVSLDTDTAELVNLVSQQQVEDLPLNGRNFMQLLLVGAGAVTVGGEQGTMRQGEGNAISVNGGRPEGNNYTLDGLVNTDAALVTPAVILSQDAIQEFKVSSGTYSADYGIQRDADQHRQQGRHQQAARSGILSSTATTHSTPSRFRRPTTSSRGTPTANPVLRQNQFGFVAGGPIYIPKVYDGRNKSFFMANYEGWRITNGARQVNYTCPTRRSCRVISRRRPTRPPVGFRLARRTACPPMARRIAQAARAGLQLHAGRSRYRTAIPRQHYSRRALDGQRRPGRRFQRLLADADDSPTSRRAQSTTSRMWISACTRTSRPIAGTRTWASWARCSSATPMPITPTRDPTTPATWFMATRSTFRTDQLGGFAHHQPRCDECE